jgi:hypothetical protein
VSTILRDVNLAGDRRSWSIFIPERKTLMNPVKLDKPVMVSVTVGSYVKLQEVLETLGKLDGITVSIAPVHTPALPPAHQPHYRTGNSDSPIRDIGTPISDIKYTP